MLIVINHSSSNEYENKDIITVITITITLTIVIISIVLIIDIISIVVGIVVNRYISDDWDQLSKSFELWVYKKKKKYYEDVEDERKEDKGKIAVHNEGNDYQ